jgi:hypothetical protein
MLEHRGGQHLGFSNRSQAMRGGIDRLPLSASVQANELELENHSPPKYSYR